MSITCASTGDAFADAVAGKEKTIVVNEDSIDQHRIGTPQFSG
jgi:hypothetical protein